MSTVEFGSLFEFIRNGMNVKQDKSGDGLPISRIETIWNSNVDPQRVGYAGLSDADCKGWLLEHGDILFSHINSVEHIGKCAVYEGVPSKLIHGMNLLCLRCDLNKLVPSYAKYLIRSPGFRGKLGSYINKAVNQASVSIGNLKSILVDVPSIPEQRRIAAILDQADALRAKRREVLAQLDRLAQAIFLEMFGDPATNPKKWLSKTLTEVCHCYSGGTPSKENKAYWSGEVPWFSAKDLKKSDLFESQDCISKSVIESTSLKLLPENTVVVVVRGMILAHTFPVSVLRVKASINQDLKALLPRLPMTPQFLAACLRAQSKSILTKVSESAHGTKRLDTEGLSTIPVLLPSVRLQEEFESRVSKIEEVRTSLQTAINESDSIFASLQHRAFRGEL